MNRELPFGWENRTSLAWWADYKSVVILSLAGLLSGLFVDGLSYPAGQLHRDVLFLYGPGAVFGVTMAVALAICVTVRIWRVILLVLLPVATAIAYCLSLNLAFYAELFVGSGNQPSISPVAMFAGGLLGGFLVLGSILVSVGMEPAEALAVALLSSPLAGALGVIGWILGPSLGMGDLVR